MDQVIEDIAEGFDRFRTDSDDLETMLLAWAYASGTYERVAEGLRSRSPDDVPERVADGVADALTKAAAALMAAAQCGAEALETAAGPAACDDAFSDATEAHRMVAVRLEPLIEYGSRPFPEVLASFS
ncbi:MAG: hypothetical protein M3N45_12420 [Actinomycetota bacterium]|nr:hypothetical protein [Actinomycetota bacterium]